MPEKTPPVTHGGVLSCVHALEKLLPTPAPVPPPPWLPGGHCPSSASWSLLTGARRRSSVQKASLRRALAPRALFAPQPGPWKGVRGRLVVTSEGLVSASLGAPLRWPSASGTCCPAGSGLCRWRELPDHVASKVFLEVGLPTGEAAPLRAHATTSADRKSVRVGKECLRLCRSRWSPYH